MYFIKTIGFKGAPTSIFEGRFPKTLLSQMRFRTGGGKTRSLKKGDKLVLYCARGCAKELFQGGFIGAQNVLAAVRREIELFDEPWSYIVDVQPEILCLRKPLPLKDVKKWEKRSERLGIALKAELQALGGLWEIEEGDYDMFMSEFMKRSAG